MLYIGPDALMPLASALAAAFGVALMFWRRLLAATRLGARALMRHLAGRRAPER